MPNLKDLAIRRQVMLERVKAGQVRGFAPTFIEIEGIVRSAVLMNDTDISTGTRKDLNTLLAQLNRDVRDVYTANLTLYTAELEETAGIFATAEAADLTATIANVSLTVPSASRAFSVASNRPMSFSGETLPTFISRFAGNETRRVSNTIRRGFTLGQTNQEMVRAVIGTRARRYKDGILATSRRNTEAIIHTATQHTASSARQSVWEANKDVVDRYQWVSTLDRKTSLQCTNLDGRIFELDKGPTPPIHIRCRSTTVSVPKPGFEFLSQGRTRSAELGPVPANQTYYSWLKDQDAGFQAQAIGRDRAKLLRDGGLSSERFQSLGLDRNFQPLTLAEMQALEPEAFRRAGVNPPG